MKKEYTVNPISGYLMLLVELILLSAGLFGLVVLHNMWFIVLLFFFVFILFGFMIINPNHSRVLVLFGAYKGTARKNGFFWTNPFYLKKEISLRARNFDSERVKVNDKVGNPILVSVILVWRVEETYKAAFEVDDFEQFVKVQSDAAVRKMAGSYPYDNFNDKEAEVTLRSGMHEINEALEAELTERLHIAGIEVMEARIGYLAYAPEIAQSMLRRQQASAIVAARYKIVEGAVGMVENALEELSKKNIIELDEDKKATMVSNLMVVLCGDRDATPVINTGTLHQ
jgi:regulator of protease activity HflC (stomatin/prohibitin superfamily)